VESLLALMLTAVATGTISDTLTGLLKRSYITIEVTSISDKSERFATALTQGGKSTIARAIYTDRAGYLADPVGNAAAAGNLLVDQEQLPDGTLVTELYEYVPAAQTLTRYENSLIQQRALLHQVSFTTGYATVFAQELGLLQAHWTVQSPYESMDFEAYGTPPRMR
jgi:hypothetical protein